MNLALISLLLKIVFSTGMYVNSEKNVGLKLKTKKSPKHATKQRTKKSPRQVLIEHVPK